MSITYSNLNEKDKEYIKKATNVTSKFGYTETDNIRALMNEDSYNNYINSDYNEKIAYLTNLKEFIENDSFLIFKHYFYFESFVIEKNVAINKLKELINKHQKELNAISQNLLQKVTEKVIEYVLGSKSDPISIYSRLSSDGYNEEDIVKAIDLVQRDSKYKLYWEESAILAADKALELIECTPGFLYSSLKNREFHEEFITFAMNDSFNKHKEYWRRMAVNSAKKIIESFGIIDLIYLQLLEEGYSEEAAKYAKEFIMDLEKNNELVNELVQVENSKSNIETIETSQDKIYYILDNEIIVLNASDPDLDIKIFDLKNKGAVQTNLNFDYSYLYEKESKIGHEK